MNTRKFWLINSLDNKLDLNSLNADFSLTDPEGLGFSKNLNTTRMGNKEEIDSAEYIFPEIKGTITFYGSSNAEIYQRYFDLVDFVRFTPLKLYYQTPNTFDSFYCDVDVIRLEKTEIKNKMMECPITFHATSFWMSKEKSETIQNVEVSNFSFPFTFPFMLGESSFSNINVYNNGALPVGMRIEMNGNIVNPSFHVSDNKGNRYGSGRFNGEFDYVFVDSDSKDEKIILKRNGVILSNPANYQEWNLVAEEITFIQLRPGQNKLSFYFDGTFDGNIVVSWEDNRVSV